MWPIVTDGVAWFLCLFVKIVSTAKTAEPTEMPFGLWTRMGSRNHVLEGVQGHIWRRKGQIVCRELCKNGWIDPDAIWYVDWGGSKEACIKWGAHWRHTANTINCPCVAVMQQICNFYKMQCVKLLLPLIITVITFCESVWYLSLAHSHITTWT